MKGKIPRLEDLKALSYGDLVAITIDVGRHCICIVAGISKDDFYSANLDGVSPRVIERIPGDHTIDLIPLGTTHTSESAVKFDVGCPELPRVDASILVLDDDRAMFDAICDDGVPNGLIVGSLSRFSDVALKMDADRWWQRNSMIVGSSGSGKSWTVAALIEATAKSRRPNVIIMDIHGEYAPLGAIPGVRRWELGKDIITPCWAFDDAHSMALLLGRTGAAAPNQASALRRAILDLKRGNYVDQGLRKRITVNSPVPYDIADVIKTMNREDSQMVEGARPGTYKQGDQYGKLRPAIDRLEAMVDDPRYAFLFAETSPGWLDETAHKLLGHGTGIKIVDLSSVPDEILHVAISQLISVIFNVQYWTNAGDRNPVSIVCDEAHLYMGMSGAGGPEGISLQTCERVAKEGRKYGISLCLVTQRPSEINRTIAAQVSNVIAMRLTSEGDRGAIHAFMSDTSSWIVDALPTLGVGECVAVGDAFPIPARVQVLKPDARPASNTVSYWQEWARTESTHDFARTVRAWTTQERYEEDKT